MYAICAHQAIHAVLVFMPTDTMPVARLQQYKSPNSVTDKLRPFSTPSAQVNVSSHPLSAHRNRKGRKRKREIERRRSNADVDVGKNEEESRKQD